MFLMLLIFTQPSAATTPHTPTAPNEPTPLSKELADVHATEKVKPLEPENNDGKLGDLHFKLWYVFYYMDHVIICGTVRRYIMKIEETITIYLL